MTPWAPSRPLLSAPCCGGLDLRRRASWRAAVAVVLVLVAREQRRLPELLVQGISGGSARRSSPCAPWCRRPCTPGDRLCRGTIAAVQLHASSASGAATGPSSTRKVASGPPSDRSELKQGQEFNGEVIRLSDHGAVVKLDGTQIIGFVHVSQIKDGYVRHPSDEVSSGQQVRVRVMKASPTFLELTIKDAGRKTAGDFIVGQEVEGRVKVVKPVAAWVDIGSIKEAMLHKTQIKDGVFVADARDFLKVGDKITARIRDKDEAKEKIELSMKGEREVLNPLQRGLKLDELKKGEELGGVVTSVRNFGCFVDVGAEADGLIHVRNINDGLVGKIDDLIRHGDDVLVRVLGFSNGKLELALASPLARLPAVDAFQDLPADKWLEGKIVDMVQFGVFVSVEPPVGPQVTAFLRYSEAENPEFMQEGEEIKVRVLRVDTEKKQLFLTMKTPDERAAFLTGRQSGSQQDDKSN
mmetsp:Transcript_93093/g.290188  ORF Transcript_93093/g.290188 Transcript_93093/m.290188 type:complete len:468 (+) Transcript_93093:93-1496(+)